MAVREPWEEIEFAVADVHEEFVAADCLSINTGADGFLVSAYAREVLTPVLREAGEFWPVRVLDQPYWWLNCMAVVDSLDRERTDADWGTVDGDWGSFSWISETRQLAFRPVPLEHAPLLFRIPEYPQGILFALDELRELIERRELTGFRFDLVWSAAEGGVRDPVGLGFRGMFDTVDRHAVAQKRELARRTIARRERQAGI